MQNAEGSLPPPPPEEMADRHTLCLECRNRSAQAGAAQSVVRYRLGHTRPLQIATTIDRSIGCEKRQDDSLYSGCRLDTRNLVGIRNYVSQVKVWRKELAAPDTAPPNWRDTEK